VNGLVAIYLAGVLVGLWRVDGPPLTKLGVSVMWPLGLAAFVVTIALLIVVAAIAFPVFGVAVVALLAASWWFLS